MTLKSVRKSALWPILISSHKHTSIRPHAHTPTCTHAHTHTHIQAHMYTHSHMYTYMHTCPHTNTPTHRPRAHTPTRVHTHAHRPHVHTHTCAHTCIHAHTSTHVHTPSHVNTHAHTHAHTHTHPHTCWEYKRFLLTPAVLPCTKQFVSLTFSDRGRRTQPCSCQLTPTGHLDSETSLHQGWAPTSATPAVLHSGLQSSEFRARLPR